MDRNCQAIRRAQTFGMLSANAKNLGNVDQANRLMAMSIYEICESGIGNTETFTQDACLNLGLVSLGKMDAAKPLADVGPQQANDRDLDHGRAELARQQQAQQQSLPPPVTIRDDRGNTVPAQAVHP